MIFKETGRLGDPYSRLGEATKQIHLAIEGCEEDGDARALREALVLIDGVRVEEQGVSDGDYPRERTIQ